LVLANFLSFAGWHRSSVSNKKPAFLMQAFFYGFQL